MSAYCDHKTENRDGRDSMNIWEVVFNVSPDECIECTADLSKISDVDSWRQNYSHTRHTQYLTSWTWTKWMSVSRVSSYQWDLVCNCFCDCNMIHYSVFDRESWESTEQRHHSSAVQLILIIQWSQTWVRERCGDLTPLILWICEVVMKPDVRLW